MEIAFVIDGEMASIDRQRKLKNHIHGLPAGSRIRRKSSAPARSEIKRNEGGLDPVAMIVLSICASGVATLKDPNAQRQLTQASSFLILTIRRHFSRSTRTHSLGN